MPTYSYDYGLVLGTDRRPLVGGTGQLRSRSGGVPGPVVPIYDMQGTPLASLQVSEFGVFSPFTADIARGYLDFGGIVLPVASTEVQDSLEQATNAQAAAVQAADTAQSAAVAAQAAQSQLAAYVIANPGGGSGGGGGGVTDHGALSGLTDDDHPQYLTAARGDARYATDAELAAAISAAVSAASTEDRKRANHSGTQLAASISDFTSAVQGIVGTGSSVDAVVRRNASAATRGYSTSTPIDIFDDLGTGTPPSWYVSGLDVLLSAI